MLSCECTKYNPMNWRETTMKKLVINQCFGGFGLSGLALSMYHSLKEGGEVYLYAPEQGTRLGRYHRVSLEDASLFYTALSHDYGPVITDMSSIPDEEYVFDLDIERDDPMLVEVVEKLGSKRASGQCAELGIVEIPDDVEWHIEEYDGIESVHENHRSWS